MLLVPTTVSPSRVHGLGLHAGRLIRGGEVVTRWDPAVDFTCAPEEVASLPEPERSECARYGYVGRDGLFRLASGAERFINHSTAPNLAGDPAHFRVALRDILPGEELFEDYSKHEPAFRGFPMHRYQDKIDSAVMVIGRQDGSVLLQERGHDPENPAFPGGKREAGESPVETAVREALEETGVEVLEAAALCVVGTTAFFVARDWRGRPRGSEEGSVRWGDVSEVLRGEFGARNAPVLRALGGLANRRRIA